MNKMTGCVHTHGELGSGGKNENLSKNKKKTEKVTWAWDLFCGS